MSDVQQELSEREKIMVVAVVGAASVLVRRRRRRRELEEENRSIQRQIWVRKTLLRRPKHGYYEKLLQELAREDRPGFKNFVRMEPALFLELLDRVGPRISRQITFMRQPLGPALRLVITIRYLATGNTYKSLEHGFRVAHNTISKIVPETCNAILAEFGQEFMKCPSTPEEWREVAEGFSDRWNFHNCLGALDGKHVAIRAPGGEGSVYYNYKHFHSIVLMALVDSKYRFLYVDVGANGGRSDGGVWQDTQLRSALEDDVIGVPPPAPFPNDTEPLPYAVVADDAFPLRSWLIKPYPQRGLTHDERIYNYRLSRARRVVENAFGILSQRFRFLLSTMAQKPENVEAIVRGACVLHNILRVRYPRNTPFLTDHEHPDSHDIIPGTWRDEECLAGLAVMHGNNATRAAKASRNYQREYYNSPVGSVHWQEDMI